MKPSLVVQVVVDGLEKTGVGIVLGGSSCVGLCHNAVASSVGIVGAAVAGVVVAVVVVAAAVAAVAVVGEFGAHAHGVAGVAVERVACLPGKSQVRSATRSEGQLREPARSPSVHSGESKIHDLVSPIARSKVVGRACTAHSGP